MHGTEQLTFMNGYYENVEKCRVCNVFLAECAVKYYNKTNMRANCIRGECNMHNNVCFNGHLTKLKAGRELVWQEQFNR